MLTEQVKCKFIWNLKWLLIFILNWNKVLNEQLIIAEQKQNREINFVGN